MLALSFWLRPQRQLFRSRSARPPLAARAQVYPGSHASASGVVSQGDTILAINGKSLETLEENPLDVAVAELGAIADGVDITLSIESDVLLAGYMQKRGEKGFKSWQKRFFVLVWSELNMAERELRYYEGQDYCTRKLKGSIDLSRAEGVKQVTIDAGAAIHIETPGRLWELLPETASSAALWFRTIDNLLLRNRGFAVVASMSSLAFADDQMLEGEEPGSRSGELTLMMQRKLGMSINKLGQEITIARLEHDGAAAACGLLSEGDALLKVNGEETSGGCKATIKMLTKTPAAVQLTLASKVVHGGWMHKLGEGFGGWTTRYFTLAYELDADAAQVVRLVACAVALPLALAPHPARSRPSLPGLPGAWPAALGSAPPTCTGTSLPRPLSLSLDSTRTCHVLGASQVLATTKGTAAKERPRATSTAAAESATLLVRLHKANQYDKLGVGLIEDAQGQVVINRVYPGFVAHLSNSLLAGDVILAVNGEPVCDQDTALKLLTESVGTVELRLLRNQDPGCWVLRYFDAKNSVMRKEKGVVRLSKETVREINSYTLQDDTETEDGVPRIGLYILQDERCWELLPPEEELQLWISKLQLAVWGQEVISSEYCNASRAEAAKDKLRDLKGPRVLRLQQQYGLMLATYDRAPEHALPAPAGEQAVYVMSFEMDGAGAASGLLSQHDRIVEVDGQPAENLQQVTTCFKGSGHQVKVKVASRVVHGGNMLKKGEVNTEYQMRWFLLLDMGDHSLLRYYDGQNCVTRVQKGEIKITPSDVKGVRQHTATSQAGEKRHGIIINTNDNSSILGTTRTYELLCQSLPEARLWFQLLNARARKKRGEVAAGAPAAARGRRVSVDKEGAAAEDDVSTRDEEAAGGGARQRAMSELAVPQHITTRL